MNRENLILRIWRKAAKRLLVRTLVCLLAFFLIGLHIWVFSEGAEKIKPEKIAIKEIKAPVSSLAVAKSGILRAEKITKKTITSSAGTKATTQVTKYNQQSTQEISRSEILKAQPTKIPQLNKPPKISSPAAVPQTTVSHKNTPIKVERISVKINRY